MNKIKIAIFINLVFNGILVYSCTLAGINKGDAFFLFEEKQAVTFFSALFLGSTSLSAAYRSYVHYKYEEGKKFFNFWGLSSLGFFYLCMDEYFMAHEGIAAGLVEMVGGNARGTHFDGLTLAFFGLIALGVCIYFRKQILFNKNFIILCVLGACGLCGTVVFDQLEYRGAVIYKLIEETFKIVGVTFFLSAYIIALTDFLATLKGRVTDVSI